MASHFGFANVTAGTRTNTSFTVPASAPTNGIALIALDMENNVTPTPPSGYTQLINIDHSGQPVDLWIWWKRLGAGEGGTTHTVTHSSTWTHGVLAVVQDASTSVNPTVGTGAQGTGSTRTANSVTPTGNNAYIGFFVGSYQDLNPVTPPTGTTPTFTERYDGINNIYFATGTLATAGATGDKSATGGNSTDWMAVMVVVEDTATDAATKAPPPLRTRITHFFTQPFSVFLATTEVHQWAVSILSRLRALSPMRAATLICSKWSRLTISLSNSGVGL